MGRHYIYAHLTQSSLIEDVSELFKADMLIPVDIGFLAKELLSMEMDWKMMKKLSVIMNICVVFTWTISPSSSSDRSTPSLVRTNLISDVDTIPFPSYVGLHTYLHMINSDTKYECLNTIPFPS